MTMHLSDKDFADCLQNPDLHRLSPQVESHLAECTACREEVLAARAAISNLQTASLTFAAGRTTSTATLLHGQERAHHAHLPRTLGWAAAGLAAALAIATSLYTGVEQHQHHATAAQKAQDTSRDDALMREVDHELAEDVAPAMQPLLVSRQTTTADNTAGNTQQER